MADQDVSHYVPTHLDDPAKFLFWTMDVAIIGLTFTSIGVLSGYHISGLLVGIFAAFLYQKAKAGSHPGLAMHLLGWYVGQPGFEDMPGSHIRELNG